MEKLVKEKRSFNYFLLYSLIILQTLNILLALDFYSIKLFLIILVLFILNIAMYIKQELAKK